MPSSRSAPPDARAPDARPPHARHAWLTARPYAHRGLHGRAIPENSRAAFLAAIDAGHGIELDARLSRDGLAVVFHDADLARMTGRTARVADHTAAELSRLNLAGTADRIEPLPAILTLVARRAPLLIEIKTDGDPRVAARLSLSVRHALEGYRGEVAVMSFDPTVGAWFAQHAPHVTRGLVVGRSAPRDFLRRRLTFQRASPHFLAHDVRALPSRLAARARRGGLPVLAWTVRSAHDWEVAQAHADQIIFESPFA